MGMFDIQRILDDYQLSALALREDVEIISVEDFTIVGTYRVVYRVTG